MLKSIKQNYFSGLSKNSVLLAFASFFSDISTEMLYPILPIYLTENLKASGGVVGFIEGIAGAIQNAIQGFSGYLSDKWQRRKPIALFGYILAALSKPFIGVAMAWPGVLAARVSDRLGVGIRSAPRDALIASSVNEKDKGKAFGLEGIGDNLGAFLGPLIAVGLFFSLQFDIRYIFYISIIPGLLTVMMIALVKEKKKSVKSKINIDLSIHKFPKEYWKYLTVIALFGIGNSSTSFLILQIKDEGLSLIDTIFVYAMFNLVAALISYPAGSLSDKFGRKPFLLISFIIFLISYVGFAFVSNLFFMGILFVFYGFFQGIFRSVGKALAADFVPENLRASSIGWYATTVGLSGMVASMVAGQLWDKINHEAVFIYGASFSILGIVALIALIPAQKSVID